jgi:type I restriction enzyme S subunit
MKTRGIPWRQVPLHEILTYYDERVELDDMVEYITITVKRRHGGLVERQRLLGSQIKTKKQFKLMPGAFIISRVQCWHQAYALVPDDVPPNMIASTNYDQFIIAPTVDARFFWWLSHSPLFTETVRSSAFGVVIEKMVFKRDLWLEKTIPLPPLEEQQRIVARIEELAALIEEAQGLRVKARVEADALAKTASAEIFERLDVPDKQWVSLDSVTGRITKGESPGWQGFDYVDDGPLFVRSQNVLWGQLDLGSETRIPLAFHNKLSRSQLRGEDVLINLVGASIGRSAVVPDDLGEANVNQAVAVITPGQEIDSRFLMLFLISPLAQRILHGGKVETARPNISLTDLRNLRVPVPSLDQQRGIVAYLDDLQAQVDELAALQEATQAELDALLPSVLDRAFRGEL